MTVISIGVSHYCGVADVWRYAVDLFVNAKMLYKGYAKRA